MNPNDAWDRYIGSDSPSNYTEQDMFEYVYTAPLCEGLSPSGRAQLFLALESHRQSNVRHEASKIRLLVDGEPCTLAEFLDANADTDGIDEDAAILSALPEGGKVTLGGGASGDTLVYRLRPEDTGEVEHCDECNGTRWPVEQHETKCSLHEKG